MSAANKVSVAVWQVHLRIGGLSRGRVTVTNGQLCLAVTEARGRSLQRGVQPATNGERDIGRQHYRVQITAKGDSQRPICAR